MFKETDVIVFLSIVFVLLIPGLLALPTPALSGTFPGHVVGIAGALLMILALVYPFRKRIQGKKGRKNPIKHHIYYGLTGSILVVLHAGHSLGSLIGNLVYISMVLVILSGIVGRYLFKRVFRNIKEQRRNIEALKTLFENRKEEISADACWRYLELEAPQAPRPDEESPPPEESVDSSLQARCEELHDMAEYLAESEYTLQVFSGTKVLFSRWIRVHIYLAVFLFAILIVHVLTNLYYGLRWLP
jgi:hypothetical protein